MRVLPYIGYRLKSIVPNPLWKIQNEDYDSIVWSDSRELPSYETLESIDPTPLLPGYIEQLKNSAISENLPTWAVVAQSVDNISNLAEAKTYLLKLSRVVYWLAKNTEE